MWDNQTIMMIVEGTGATLYMTLVSTLIAYALGLPLGIVLVHRLPLLNQPLHGESCLCLISCCSQ